jgi:uncharacterized protein YqjF (DUF2071 family)
MRGVFLRAEWRNLAVVSYSIDPEVLKPHLPVGLRLDLWQGQALVSLVGFQFRRTRILGIRIPFWGTFPEVNLRFYVTRNATDGERRGVVFVREIVPHGIVAWIARNLYNENYDAMPMSEQVVTGSAEYAWRPEERTHRLRVTASGLPRLPDDESLDTWIVDHHWGYSRGRDGVTIEYEVDRLPWRTYPVGDFEVDVDATAMYGAEFAKALGQRPISVVLAEGSKVSVSFGRRLR